MALEDVIKRFKQSVTPVTPQAEGGVTAKPAPDGECTLVTLGTPEINKLELSKLQQAAGDDWPDVKDNPEMIRALASSIHTLQLREQGIRPPHYTQRAICTRCGPVWIWPTSDTTLNGCPWCHNRVTGKPIPRPEKEVNNGH